MNALPLFDAPREPEPLTPKVNDIRRLIESKAGTFRELLEGGAVGREFRIAELEDGRIVRQYMDGTRGRSPGAITPFLIDDALKAGIYAECEL